MKDCHYGLENYQFVTVQSQVDRRRKYEVFSRLALNNYKNRGYCLNICSGSKIIGEYRYQRSR